ncbi:MAG: SusC/RagA family TonB-linked outer membrane protein [Candidatus Pseudobacter hemicellulosilyticus]|uniref:SusC/RagA family TonB-linked outer membrane protein n=1 Tax=Candidatus Pseudobacter hemicellulosilyticus TaxID=3121375 RepID=A0AAJ5WPQ9_9BACT|nr:MAG: SusC/RagA family TonB-linked outer membrane protein [Pseudobacter sp.]
MRVTFLQVFCLLFLISNSLFNQVKAQHILMKKVSINENGAELGSVLKKLENSYSLNFVYSPQLIDIRQKVNVFSHERPLAEVLTQLLSPLSLIYEASDDVIVIRKLFRLSYLDSASSSRVVPVTGRVVDEKSGEPLAGVTVSIRGKYSHVATDAGGIYSINNPDPEDILVFTIVGYEPEEVPVGRDRIINMVMKIKALSMSEVVVVSVGYGTQKARHITGAAASANLDPFKDAPNTNFASSLQGSVPGLNVGPVSIAGSTPQISIRGKNTISGNTNALIILDGIQYNGTLGSINPDDIASIDILKDASSTAVYGAQAANGVILITTHKGTNNTRARISFSSSYSTQQPSNTIRPMKRDQYLEHVRMLYWDEAFLGPDYTSPNPNFNLALRVDASQRDASNKLVETDFDWYDAATKPGFIQNNLLRVSGGGERVNYLISGSFTNQAGFIVNDIFKRKSIRANIETQPRDWIKLGIQSFAAFVNQDGAEPTLGSVIQMAPLNTPYNEDGTLKPYPFNTNQENPFMTYDVSDYYRSDFYFANIYGEISFPFIKGLSYRLNFGNNLRQSKHYYASQYGAGLTGSAYKNNEQYNDYTLDNILSYNRSFNKHNITTTLLYGALERTYDNFQATANGFTRLNLGYNNLSLGTNQFTTSEAWSEALLYQMARINYAFDNRYLLTATVRRDGFSGFAANEKFGIFPSVALGWIFSDEVVTDMPWLNFGKLRLGYGVSGNQTSRYNSLDKVTTQIAYIFGDGGTTEYGQFVGSLANPNLRWEKTFELNTGLDFRVLDSRLSGSIDFYIRRTKDLLYSVEIPTISGFNNINTNVGEIGNRGIEISLTSKNIDARDFKWTSTVNFSRNVNRVYELLGTGDLVSSNLFIGQSLGAIYNYRTNGIYQVNEKTPDGFYTGNLRVVDMNGDGKYTTDDRVILGTTDPAYRFSVLNSFTYKNFSLTVFINSIQGGKNGYLGSNSHSLQRNDNAIRWNYINELDFWNPGNPDGEYPMYINGPSITPTIYKDRSFIRLQDINLSYKLNRELVQKWGIQGLYLFVSGKNLATWTRWKGWDPELANGGLTINGRPLLKGYSIGFNLAL